MNSEIEKLSVRSAYCKLMQCEPKVRAKKWTKNVSFVISESLSASVSLIHDCFDSVFGAIFINFVRIVDITTACLFSVMLLKSQREEMNMRTNIFR